MDLDCLETFLAVAKSLSFTKAAEARYLTQPAVSRQISRLEQDLGVKLFVRAGRRVRLTPEGRFLADEGHRIVAQLAATKTALGEFTGLSRGLLRVGASSTPGLYILPSLLADFRRRYGGIELRFELSNTETIQRMIFENDLDLGFVGQEIIAEGVTCEHFAHDRIVMICPAGHPLCGRRKARLDQVIAEPYVAREPGSATRQVFETALRQRGLRWAPFLELASPEAVKQAVAAGLGLAAVSRCSIEWELAAKRLVELPVAGLNVTRNLFVAYRRGSRPTAAAKAFLDMSRVSGR